MADDRLPSLPSLSREYDLLMSSLNVSVSKHLLDAHFTVIWANDRYYQMFGYSKAAYEARFQNRCDLYYQNAPEDWRDLVDMVSRSIAAGKNKYECVVRMPHRDGRRLWVNLVGNFTEERVNGYQVSYTVMMDITAQMQRKVEQTITYNNFPGYIAKYRITPKGAVFLDANQKFLDNFSADPQKWKTSALVADLLPGKQMDIAMRSGEPVSMTLSPTTASGKRTYLHATGECVDRVSGDPVYLFLYDDITALTEQRNEFKRMAYTDPVTGGHNRALFEKAAAAKLAAAPPRTYSLVWLNICKFKIINDLQGTQAGDRTLQYVYSVLRSGLQPGELVARSAADNFCVLLKTCDPARIVQRLHALAERVNAFNHSKAEKYILNFTAGIYPVTDLSMPIAAMLERAHLARKSAQAQAQDSLCLCNFYTQRALQRLLADNDMENHMRDALRNGEFEVYLQPKMCTQTGRPCGAEALVRWRMQDGKLAPPGSFVPLFEKNGFIVQVDLYVFEQVCALLRKWIDRGLTPVPVSVNMSRMHLQADHFMAPYTRIRQRYRVPKDLLEIELTESMVADNAKAFAGVVGEIHRAGFSCSMDDFGCGFSSLNVLKDLQVDTLKLDRGFCSSKQMDNPRERAVLRAVIQLAKDLHMRSVAEGVETPPQLAFLREASCDWVQGYIFARPLPVHAFERLVWGKSDTETPEGE